MVTDIAREAAIERLGNTIDTGITHDPDDVAARLSSNTDKTATVYSMLNGEPKTVLANDLKRVLMKTLPNGQPAHWAEGMPGEPPEYVKGNVKCMLHPEFDESDGPAKFARDYVDSVGLSGRTCNMNAPDKANRADFRSVYDRDDHMAKKHPREWETLQAALKADRETREADERRQDREANRRQGDALMAMAGANVTPSPAGEAVVHICDIEGCDHESPTDVALARHKRMATDDAHAQAREASD